MDSFHDCLELGCGVGRVTGSLAKRFATVTAVDISAAHLRVAQDYLNGQRLSNVSYRHLEAIEDVSRLPDFDVFYSRIVLQHNPPPVMLRLLTDLLGKLRSGGVAFFQIPTYRSGYHFRIDDYLQQQNETQMEMHFLPQAALMEVIAQQGCRILEVREDDSIGLSVAAVSNTLLLQKVG